MLATAFILKRKASFLLLYSLHYYMSGKNSKTPIVLGLLTTIFLFSMIQLAFERLKLAFERLKLAFQRFNWLF